MKNLKKSLVAGLVTVGYSLPLHADVITIGFEEFGLVEENEPINDFYDGGTNNAGVTGPERGVTFSENSLVLTSQETGEPGSAGNFENNPEGDNIMYFLGGEAATMNVDGGFATGFSFYYTANAPAFIDVYSEPDGQGDLIESLELSQNWQDNQCLDTSQQPFCNFDPIGVEFDGTAQSIDFGGTINQVGFDAVTLGTDTPGEEPAEVPAPTTLALLAAGLAGFVGLGFTPRRQES